MAGVPPTPNGSTALSAVELFDDVGPAYEKAFAEAYPTRAQYGDNLWGYWHTEIGPLNQIVHIWAYESLQQRADIRAASMKDTSGKWPPTAVGREVIISQESDIILPIKGVNETPGKQEWGGLYELRMYTYQSGELPKDADPELLADALMGPIVMRRLMFAKPLDPKRVPALVTQILPD